MKRILEPELMAEDAQARAYAEADFESAHSRYPELFAEEFPGRPRNALVLDLGCCPCDVTIRFARANPCYTFHAVDGSPAMLRHAPRHDRIQLIEGHIPDVTLPGRNYDVIISSSLLHHLPDPQALWQTVRRHAKTGALVFVVDLVRPATREEAKALAEKYSAGEPEVLKRDFLNSLLAAFTPREVQRQIADAGLDGLRVQTISDRHLMAAGRA